MRSSKGTLPSSKVRKQVAKAGDLWGREAVGRTVVPPSWAMHLVYRYEKIMAKAKNDKKELVR